MIKIIKRLHGSVFLIIASFLCVLPRSAFSQSLDGDVRFTAQERSFIKKTVVTAATTTNWPPFAFVDSATGEVKGIGYDYWREIIKTAGIHAKIVKFDDFTKQLLSLKNKETDLMYSSGVTKDRKKFAKFTHPYATFPIAIATSKEENFIQDGSFLRNKKVAIGRNFTAHTLMVKAYPDITYVPVDNIRQGLQLVSQGKAFAYVDIMPTLAFAINKYGFTNLKISGNTGLTFELRLMIRNDYPELVSIANKVIANFDPDLKRKILNRWINVQYQQAFDYKKYMPYAVGFLVLVLIIIYQLQISKRRAHAANKELERRVNERTRELQESQSQLLKLSQALEQSPNLVFITDTDANIEYANPQFLRTTGYTWDEIIGRNPRILQSEKLTLAYYQDLWQTILSGEIWRGEVCDRCKDGSFFWASASISPIRDENGQITHYLAVHEDITKHREAELAMKLAVERSEIANRSKTEMLANMSHELRTPLNAIIGFSDTMRNQVFGPFTNEKYVEYANDINNSGVHLLELINDILDFSSIEADKLNLVEDVIDVADVLDSSIRLIAARLEAGKIKITTQYQHNRAKILADKRRLKQIALNLLSNSAKFTNEGGHVSVSTTLSEEGALEIVFADTGIGMTAKNLEIAMTRFGQVDGSLARKHQGTGLGLPLTQKLVEAHGGTFTIESEEGVGTKIIITFPKEKVIL